MTNPHHKALETVLTEYVGHGKLIPFREMSERSGVHEKVIRALADSNRSDYTTRVESFFDILKALPAQAHQRYWFLLGMKAPKRIKSAPVCLKKALAAVTALSAKIAAALAKDRPDHRDEAEIRDKGIPEVTAVLSSTATLR